MNKNGLPVLDINIYDENNVSVRSVERYSLGATHIHQMQGEEGNAVGMAFVFHGIQSGVIDNVRLLYNEELNLFCLVQYYAEDLAGELPDPWKNAKVLWEPNADDHVLFRDWQGKLYPRATA